MGSRNMSQKFPSLWGWGQKAGSYVYKCVNAKMTGVINFVASQFNGFMLGA